MKVSKFASGNEGFSDLFGQLAAFLRQTKLWNIRLKVTHPLG